MIIYCIDKKVLEQFDVNIKSMHGFYSDLLNMICYQYLFSTIFFILMVLKIVFL